MSRQQRRQNLKQGLDTVSKRGMDLNARQNEQWWSVAAAARILYDILDTRSATRASNAAKRAHQFFETSLERNPSDHKIECGKGCSFCCHVSVTAMAPEIFLVANQLRAAYPNDFDARLTRLRVADANTRGLDSYNRALKKLPCGLLENDGCSVYSARPSACRGMTSIAMVMCQRAFNGENVQVQTPAVWTILRNAHKQAMWAALVAAGLPAESYEFHQALVTVLDTPDAESRWLAGEDVFAGCAREAASPAEREHNRQIIDQLVAGALGKEPPQAN